MLLKNKAQALPLKPGGKIAVIGPHANATRFLIQVDTGQICGGDGTFDCVESPFQAVQRLNVGGSTTMAVGCDLIDASPNVSTAALKAAAVAAAHAADTVVLAIGIGQCGCMGIHDTYMVEWRQARNLSVTGNQCATGVVPPYAGWNNCWDHSEVRAGEYVGAEAHDKILIDLPPVQRDLAATILGLGGKKVVLIVLNGGSVDIGPELEEADAAIEAFYPGSLGAGIIANSLFGVGKHFNRWGRMPFTTYAGDFVHETPMAEQDLSVAPGRTYQYYTGKPLVPFGFGLSLSNWSMSTSSRGNLTLPTGGGTQHTVPIQITNHGPFTGDMVVTAYLVPLQIPTQAASKLIRKLWSFERAADVAVGASAVLQFMVSAEALTLFDLSTGDIVCAPGQYELVFDSGDGVTMVRLGLTITGAQQIIEPFPKA